MKTVTYKAYEKLICNNCSSGNDGIICLSPTLTASGYGYLNVSIRNVSEVGVSCREYYTYIIKYDELELTSPSTDLTADDITGIICRTCLTSYIDAVVTQNKVPVVRKHAFYGNPLVFGTVPPKDFLISAFVGVLAGDLTDVGLDPSLYSSINPIDSNLIRVYGIVNMFNSVGTPITFTITIWDLTGIIYEQEVVMTANYEIFNFAVTGVTVLAGSYLRAEVVQNSIAESGVSAAYNLSLDMQEVA